MKYFLNLLFIFIKSLLRVKNIHIFFTIRHILFFIMIFIKDHSFLSPFNNISILNMSYQSLINHLSWPDHHIIDADTEKATHL